MDEDKQNSKQGEITATDGQRSRRKSKPVFKEDPTQRLYEELAKNAERLIKSVTSKGKTDNITCCIVGLDPDRAPWIANGNAWICNSLADWRKHRLYLALYYLVDYLSKLGVAKFIVAGCSDFSLFAVDIILESSWELETLRDCFDLPENWSPPALQIVISHNVENDVKPTENLEYLETRAEQESTVEVTRIDADKASKLPADCRLAIDNSDIVIAALDESLYSEIEDESAPIHYAITQHKPNLSFPISWFEDDWPDPDYVTSLVPHSVEEFLGMLKSVPAE